MTRLLTISLVLLLSLLLPLQGLASDRPPAGSHTEDLAASRVKMSPLTRNWAFHPGDNPLWAQPGFDDTAWPSLKPSVDWSTQGYTEQDGLAWFRLRLRVPPSLHSLVLLMPRVDKSYQLFADGHLIGQVGGLPPGRSFPVTSASRVFTIPLATRETPQEIVLALRFWQAPRIAGVRPSVLRGTVYVGEEAAVLRQFALLKASRLLADGGVYTVDIVVLIVGVASLILFWLMRRQRFYLWLACFAALQIVQLLIGYASQHFAWNFFATLCSYMLQDFFSTVVLLFLVLDLLDQPRAWAWLPSISAFLSEIFLFLLIFYKIPLVLSDGLYFFFAAVTELFLIGFMVRGWRAGRVDARLLLLPLGLSGVVDTLGNLGHFLANLHLSIADKLLVGDISLLQNPFEISVGKVANVISILGMLAVLVYRFARTSQDRERLASALQAAHDVQYQLVPSNLPSLGGFSTEIAYMAAEEVGGDFCQVLPRCDGSMLLAIGDVSGKGLRAAMLGTLCVGALRSVAEEDTGPAEILERLNKVVLRTEYAGFITCLCAHISCDGRLTLANAGHLAPYLNGKEIPLEAGLPLGLLATAEYTDQIKQLPPSARLTVLSDGVVEARSISGELFGFDRTANVSHFSASHIAQEARKYGPQHDDITVLTLDWKAAMQELASLH